MADEPIQMTRAEYEATYGAPATVTTPVDDAPIQMTRAQYEATYSAPPLTAGQTFAGGMSDILSKLTFGGGDELAAAGSSVYDDVKSAIGNVTGLYSSEPGSYDDRLAQTRGLIAGYQKEHPISSAMNNLAALWAPVPIAAKEAAPVLEGAPQVVAAASPLKTAALNILKGTGVGASYGAAGGFLGGEGEGDRVQGAGIGALLGSVVGGGVSTLAEGASGVKSLINSATPNEDEALLRAFRITDQKSDQTLPVLQSLKKQGIISDPAAESPFSGIQDRLTAAQKQSRTDIGKALDGKSLTVSEIWPESSMMSSAVKSGADNSAAVKALQSEQDNLTKIALVKNFPPPEGGDPLLHGETLMKQYKGFEAAAKAGDADAKDTLKILDGLIDNTELSGNELWQIRQSYDGQSTWNKIDPKGKSIAYRGLRDDLQSKLLELGGPGTDQLFADFSAQMKGTKAIERMAGRESKGLTQESSALPAPLKTVLHPVISTARSFVGGLERSPPGETLLKQAFGQSRLQNFGNGLDSWANAIAPRLTIAPSVSPGVSDALLSQTPYQRSPRESSLPIPGQQSQGTQGLSRPLSSTSDTSNQQSTTLSKLLQSVIPEASATEANTMPQSKAFNTKVANIAKDLDADPAHLLAVMNFETGGELASDTKNKAGSGATGLIQFMPATAKALTGADTKEAAIKILKDMTPTEQLDYVKKYLEPFKGKLDTLADVYMAVLYPKAVGKEPGYALFREGTKAYWQNRGLDINQDGVITKAEASSKVQRYNGTVEV